MRYELNSAFFEKILRKFENDDGVHVKWVEISQACGVGENFISDVKRVKIQGSNSQIKDFSKNLIVKLVIDNEDYVKNFGLDRPFLNEIIAYEKIIPELQKYSREKLSFPACIFADKGIIVLEDFSTQGYKNVDKGKGFSITQVQNILKELAKLHSASIVAKLKNGDDIIDKISQGLIDVVFDETETNGTLLDGQSTNIEIAIRAFQELPENEYNRNTIASLKTLKLIYPRVQCEVVTKKRKFNVINHGDTWGNNILVNPNDDIKLIDLQIMRYSSVAADLSYFLYINLTPHERREKGDQFLNFYLNNLNNCIKEQGINLEKELTIDWLNNEMKEFAIFGCMSALWLLPIFFFKKDDLNIDNFDKDEYKNVDYQWARCSEDFKVRIREIVTDFFDHNDIGFYQNYVQK